MSAQDAEAIATFDVGFPLGAWTILAGPQP